MLDAPRRILLVEDDLLFSTRILSAVRKLGHTAETATSRTDALGRCDAASPDLVLVNLASRKLGGLDLVRTLRARLPTGAIIAYLSHVRIPEIRADARAAGVDRLYPNSSVMTRLPQILERLWRGAPDAEEDDEAETSDDAR